ncbi:MAG: hypothetical protein E4H14_13865 [Candidatus Thorarchaeota archaeon]|nr:MAG: hypothetical protein E4H14_13865 [Candidatus Thorarchaeota archaeon]
MTSNVQEHVTTQAEAGYKIIEGEVTSIETRRGLYGQEVESFSITTWNRSVLVLLPKRIACTFSVGSTVWIMGEFKGLLRIHATRIFLPLSQKCIEMTYNKLPSGSIFATILFSLVFIIKSPLLVFIYLIVPVSVGYALHHFRPIKPTLYSHEAWELVDEQVRKPDREILYIDDHRTLNLRIRVVLAIGIMVLLLIDILLVMIPLQSMMADTSLPQDFVLASVSSNMLLFGAILLLTLKILVDLVRGVVNHEQ